MFRDYDFRPPIAVKVRDGEPTGRAEPVAGGQGRGAPEILGVWRPLKDRDTSRKLFPLSSHQGGEAALADGNPG